MEVLLKKINMSRVMFLPWIGTEYQQGIKGKKVLVLGESHYCANEGDAVPTLTQEIIMDLFNPNSPHEGYKNTYTKFAKAIAGTDLDYKGKEKVWNSLAFYNYVQVPISGARVAPTAQEFRAAESALFEVLEQLQPDYVIVWGNRLYDNLPNTGAQGKEVIMSETDLHEVWCYTLSNQKIVPMLRMTHPSAAYSWDYWHEVINMFLTTKY